MFSCLCGHFNSSINPHVIQLDILAPRAIIIAEKDNMPHKSSFNRRATTHAIICENIVILNGIIQVPKVNVIVISLILAKQFFILIVISGVLINR